MKRDSIFHPLKLIVGFLVIVAVGLLLTGCGTTWRVEYDSPQYGNAAVQVSLPKKEGYAK